MVKKYKVYVFNIIYFIGFLILIFGFQNCSGGAFAPVEDKQGSGSNLAQCQVSSDPGRVTAHRLNNIEYENTIQNIFTDPSFSVKGLLPRDILSGHFANISEGLTLTLNSVESYFNISDQYIDNLYASNPSKIILCDPNLLGVQSCAKNIINTFGEKIYRRPLSSMEETQFLNFLNIATSQGDGFDEGIKLAVKAMLVSPYFLFRVIQLNNPNNPNSVENLDEFELASRLSYFLWSSNPDSTLMNLAKQGLLKKQIKQQITRMLNDPKSISLVDNFSYEWLGLNMLEGASPDSNLFPTYDVQLKNDMIQETKLFLNDIYKGQSPVLDILFADYSYLNDRLGSHYGISGSTTSSFQRMSIKGTGRQGIMSHGSILTMTSNATHTNAIRRGFWVLDRMLCSPPPDPPPGIPVLNPPGTGILTLKEEMAAHRSNPACFGCHASMDPIGLGFENFDVIGRWRTSTPYGVVDSSGNLPDGRAFVDLISMETEIDRNHEFGRCFTKELVTYALGRQLASTDLCQVSNITEKTTYSQQSFETLVYEIVNSDFFMKQRGE